MNNCLAMNWIVVATFGGVFFVTFIVMFLLFNRRMKAKPAPRDQRKVFRFLAWFWIALLIFQLAMIVFEGRKIDGQRLLMLACWGVPIAIYLYQFHRRRTDEEIQKNYAYDQQRCGRCDYDLTGNTTGICSECGWEIPVEPIPLVDPRWYKWWQKWDIDYLDKWQKRFWGVIVSEIMFVALIVFYCVWLADAVAFWAGTVFAVLIMIQMGITAIRIYQYGRRERAKEDRGTSESESACQQGMD